MCVVFDGYNLECLLTKSHEHQRRKEGACADVKITPDAIATSNVENFLLNNNNKDQFNQAFDSQT